MEYTSMKVSKEILNEMNNIKAQTGISIYRLFENAWNCYMEKLENESKEEK